MTVEDTAKLQLLYDGPFWEPLVRKMGETVDQLHQRSLQADTKEEAEILLHEARAAHKFRRALIMAVETDAQGE